MVAVVTGNTLGLVAGSAGVLGGNGQLGSAATGRGGDIAFVNASTGNLTIQRQDELLLGLGPDIGIVRTYNSQGLFDFDNNDNWQISLYRRVFGLTGTVNTAASTIKRTSADGAELTYTYDATLLKYVNKDGAGSFDTLTFNSAANTWTWVDGDSRTAETFELQVAGTYRIKNLADTDGNTLTYSYNNATDSLITQVLSANGERTDLIYNATKQLTQINVVNSSSVTTTRVRYTYENATATARLTSVSTDLSPADGVIADNNTYTTTYGYDGLSKRITSIVNSVGVSAISVTRTDFTYETTGAFRVLTVKDGTNNITTFAYPTTSTATVTDAKGQITTLTYSILTDSSQKLLTRVQGPAGSGQDINYLYDTNGNVSQMTDSRGNWTVYTYDVNGNQLTQQDMLGNTIVRTYTTSNQMLTETVYTDVDSTPGVLSVSNTTTIGTGTAQTTRYVYDNSVGGTNNRLRFIISPEGRVTEYRYNTNGTRASTIQYTGNLFAVAGAVTEAQLMTWVGATLYSEDFDGAGTPAINRWNTQNGNLAITNGKLNISSGPAAADNWPGFSSATTVTFAPGQLFRTEISLGALSPVNGRSFSLGIEGVGGRAHLIAFEDNAIKAMQNNAGVWSTFNSSLTASANTTYVVEIETTATGSILYIYQKGQSRAQGWSDVQATGAWLSYEVSGSTTEGPGRAVTADSIDSMSITVTNQAQVIDKSKSQRVDYTYDVRGQLWKTNTYKTINAVTGTGVIDANMAVTQYVYDQAGNLVQSIDARGMASSIVDDYVTSYSYDGLNRLISTSLYDATGLDAIKVTTTTVYNDSLLQAKVTLANGLVTTTTYDTAGRLLSVANGQAATPAALGTTAYLYDTLGQLRQVTDATGQNTYYLYDTLGRKVGTIDPQLALTEYVYNNNNQVVRIIQYSAAVTAALTPATALTNTLATAGIRVATPATDRTNRNLYDKAGRLAKQIDAMGAVTEYQYDGASRLVKAIGYANLLTPTQLTALAALTTEPLATDVNTLAVVDAIKDRITRQLYSNDGLLLGKLDAEGYFSSYSYDAASRNTSVTRYKNAVQVFGTATLDFGVPTIVATAPTTGNVLYVLSDASNDQTSYNIYNARGQLEGTVDALGYLTEFQYDLVGNRTLTKRYATFITYTVGASVAASRPADALTNTENQSTTTAYDANNRITSNTSSPDGLITNYTYDAVGNLTQQVRTFAGATALNNRSQFKQYDQLGRVTRELSGEGVLAQQALVAPTQAQIEGVWDSYGTRYSYDLAGRVIVAIAPNGTNAAGNKTLYYYDTEGKLKYQVNALGEVTEFIYSQFDQRTATRQYKTRILKATLDLMTGGLPSLADATTLSNLVAGSYVETATTYDNAGRAATLTDALGNANTRTYNAFGELFTATNKIDASNNIITSYSYDKRGMVKTTTEDAAGLNRITAAIYDAFGRITQTTDGRGGIVKRTYDRLGREVTVTDALNTQTQTSYDAFSRVTKRRDGRGVAGNYDTVSYSYNSTARTMTMTSSIGVSVITERNRFGETVTVTDGRGAVSTYTYNADGQLKTTTIPTGVPGAPTNSITTINYDFAGKVLSSVDVKLTQTSFTYDAANRVLSRTVDPISANPAGLNLTTEYRYDALGRQLWVKDAKGVYTRTDYDAKGQVTSMVVDPSLIPDATGNLANPLVANAAGLNITTSFTYDARGKRLTVTEGAGSAQPKTTAYAYDKLGRLSQTIVDPGVGKLNLTTSYTYDKNDNVVIKTDANLNKTVYRYDANNRLIYTVDALGNVTKNDYDVDGNVVTTTVYGEATSIATRAILATLQGSPEGTLIPLTTDATNRISRNVYDTANRRTFSIDALGYVTKYEYNANGNVRASTRYATAIAGTIAPGVAPVIVAIGAAVPSTGSYVLANVSDQVQRTYYDGNGRAVFSTDALGYLTSYVYDANSNLTRTTQYANALVGSLASGAPPTIATTAGTGNYVVSSANDQVTQMTYDAANRVITSTNGLGIVTSYNYDENGNQLSVTEAVGVVGKERTTYQEFDKANRKTAAVDALGYRTETTYDAMGNIVTVKDAKGAIGYFYYDAAGRMTLQANPTGPDGAIYYALIEIKYDALGNQTDIIRYANVITSTPVVGTRPTLSPNADLDQLQKVAYEATGRKLNIKTAFANTGGQNLDATNSYIESFTYDAFGNISTATARNGAVTTYSYDKLNRKFTEIVTGNNGKDTTVTLQSTKFEYDAASNLTTKTEAVGMPEQRITTYTYTLNNQQASEAVNAYLNTTQTSVATTKTKTYDARGNVSSETDANNKITYHYYDLQNRKTATVDANNVMMAFVYDAVGNKSSQTTYKGPVTGQTVTNKPTPTLDAANDRTMVYSYDAMGRETSSEVRNMVVGTVSASNTYNALTTTNLSKSFVYDANGNVIRSTDANGNVTRAYYRKSGEKIAEVDAAGYLTRWTYDVYGNMNGEYKFAKKPSEASTPLTVTDATTITEILAVIDLLLVSDTNVRATTRSYDRLNRMLTETRANVAQGSINSSNGLLTANTANATTYYAYNGLGNVIQKTDAVGATTSWAYDNIGRETNQSDPIFTDNSRVVLGIG